MLSLQLRDPPVPSPASHQGFPMPGHPSAPSLRPRKGLLRRQGLGLRDECRLGFQQARERNQSAQAASIRSGHLGLAPWGVRPRQPACSWGALRPQRKGVLLGATRSGGLDTGGSGSQDPRVHAGRPLHHAEKVPSPARPPPLWGEASSPASTQPCPLGGTLLVRSGGHRAVTPLGLT